jgi:hypothetical protein
LTGPASPPDRRGLEPTTSGCSFVWAREGDCSARSHQGAEPHSEPAHLAILVEMFERETWVIMGADVKGDISGLPGAQRAGHQERRGPVLHAAPADQGMVGMRPAGPGKTSATRLRHRWLLPRRVDFITTPSTISSTHAETGDQDKPLTFDDLSEFFACLQPRRAHKRHETWSEKNHEPLAQIRLRRSDRPRLDQPRHLLLKTNPSASSTISRSRGTRRRHHHQPASRTAISRSRRSDGGVSMGANKMVSCWKWVSRTLTV